MPQWFVGEREAPSGPCSPAIEDVVGVPARAGGRSPTAEEIAGITAGAGGPRAPAGPTGPGAPSCPAGPVGPGAPIRPYGEATEDAVVAVVCPGMTSISGTLPNPSFRSGIGIAGDADQVVREYGSRLNDLMTPRNPATALSNADLSVPGSGAGSWMFPCGLIP